MASAGIASRRASEELIFAGKVRVNGRVVLKPETRVVWGRDKIEVAGQGEITSEEPKVYYLLNKPSGYVCSNKPLGSKKLVIDLFRPIHLRLFTVGRLDRDTTGLLIVTNDGHFANKVIHPFSNLEKEYLVKVQEEISHEHLVTMSEGALVEGVWVKPKSVIKVRRGTVKIVVMEGKKREVRCLVQSANLNILSLQRIRIGGLVLGKLPEGDWKELSDKERKLIFNP